MDFNEKKILTATSLAHFLSHFFVLAFTALVMPISRSFDLAPDRVIALSFPMYLCYGLLAIPWGYVSDRYQPRIIMGAGLLLAGCGFMAAARAQSEGHLSLCLALVGAGCSAYHPSGLALLSKGIRQRGTALGVNGLFGNLGIAGAPLAAGILCYLFGWQTTLGVLGIVAVLSGLLIIGIPFSVFKDRDLQLGTTVERQRAVLLFLLLCVAMFFSGLLYRGFTVVLPTFFEVRLTGIIAALPDRLPDFLRINASAADGTTLIAAMLTSAVFLIGMAGQLFGGKVADRHELRWAYLVFFSCALPFLVAMGFMEGLLLVVPAGCFTFFSLGMQPIENSLVAMVTPPRWRAVSYGIKFTIVFGAGSLSVYLVSFVQNRYGLDQVPVLLCSYLVMVILSIVVLLIYSRGSSIRHG